MSYSNQPLIGDPIPIRQGKPYGGGRGMLTAREMVMVQEVLKDASSRKNVRREPQQDEDLWTAFVSLLQGRYIVESYPGSQLFVLSPKGATYYRQIQEGR